MLYTANELREHMIKRIKYNDPHGGLVAAIDKIITSRDLKSNEYYVHDAYYVQDKYINWDGRGSVARIINVALLTITNYSNICWLEYTNHSGLINNNLSLQKSSVVMEDFNVPLHSSYLDILQIIDKFPSPGIYDDFTCVPGNSNATPSISYSYYDKNSKTGYGKSCGSGSELVNKPNQKLFDTIKHIMELNKYYYTRNISKSEIFVEYEVALKKNEEKDEKIIDLEKQIKILNNALISAIPLNNQCCICFSFTERKQFCIPCGHTQYCTSCIEGLQKCALCRESVEKISNVY